MRETRLCHGDGRGGRLSSGRGCMAVRPISANSSAGAPAETAARFICSPLLNAKRTSRSNVKTRALETHKDAVPGTTKTLVHRHPHIPSLHTPRGLLK